MNVESLGRAVGSTLIALVRCYQIVFAPLLPQVCRFQPSCSQYMIDAIEEWGPLKGIWLGLRWISRCHPWGGHGHDPVPKRPRRK